MSARSILFATAFLRALATSGAGVLLGLALAAAGWDGVRIGLAVGVGLGGGALAMLGVTLAGDRLGRRRTLVVLALAGTSGTALVSAFTTAWPMMVGAFVGMLNGMGRDRGAALVIEQAALPGTATDAERTRVFAWYNVCQDLGHALGALFATLPAPLRAAGFSDTGALRFALGATAVPLILCAPLYLRLGPAIEQAVPATPVRVSPATRSVLVRISALFALDGVGGGFLTTSLLAYFFFVRFGASAAAIGGLFFAARAANAASHLAAAWLARRIGLVNTMVLTHMPSSVLLLTVAFAPSFGWAAVLFIIREGLVEMDVPTRQSYVMALVRPEERTLASGVTNLVRAAAWSVASPLAGLAMGGVSLVAPLFAGAGLKIAYDAALWGAFRRLKPPEERGGIPTARL